MAGDWIKMRVGLTTHPRVLRIAECLLDSPQFAEWAGLSYSLAGVPSQSDEELRAERHAALRVTRYVTVTALLRFWGYANEHAKGDRIAGIWPEDVDEVTGVPGFALAIEAAGWVAFDPNDGGLRMPNFEEHNTSSSERSSGGAERQRRYRERKKLEAEAGAQQHTESDVTRDVTLREREEKRREEKKKSNATVAALPDWIPGDAWSSFAEMRRKIRAPLTDKAKTLAIAELGKLRDQGHDPRAVLEQSVLRGWRGLFELKAGGAKAPDKFAGAI